MNDPKEHVQASRMGKWPFYAALAVLVACLGVLIYSLHFSGTNKDHLDQAKSDTVAHDNKPLVVDSGGLGVAGSLPAVEPKKENAPSTIPPIVVVTSSESPEARRAHDEILQRKHQVALSALSAPLGGKKGKDADVKDKASASVRVDATAPVQAERQGVSPVRMDRGQLMGGQQPGGDYNPAAEKDKEAFFDRAGQDKWQSSYKRTTGYRFEVKTGSVIPAVMISGINSELPGQIVAQVSRNVLDTADGKHLLIPQGAKLYGVYDSRTVYGQSRVLIAWNRVIFPDGSAITLEAMPGADSAGYSGVNDEVNNHYFRIFGTAFLMSLFTGGTAWAVDSVTPHNTTTNSSPTLQQQLTSSLAVQIGQTSAQVLGKNLNIKPTLEIRPGYPFNVVVTKDLVFAESYHD
ncbi:MAG: conjugal transfer protein TrbI [Desulfovibrionaceae bacterium]|nr:conjugal transfer protein TrbI [Desulfovibrionaceae bacterium]MBF0515099.1 conjugal transfer protein TrbI [Desulfovibrionaceae bacterium]